MQVADQFHLWQDLAEAVEKAVLACLAAMDPLPGPDDPGGPEPRPGGAGRVPRRARPRAPPGHPARERYAAVQVLHARRAAPSARSPAAWGWPATPRMKVAHAASIDELLVKATRPSILDPFKPYLNQRWNDGITSAAALHEEIRARGWEGGILTVERYLRQFRTADCRDRMGGRNPSSPHRPHPRSQASPRHPLDHAPPRSPGRR